MSKKTLGLITGVTLALLISLAIVFYQPVQNTPTISFIDQQGDTITIEVALALTEADIKRGLMGIEHLDNSRGMLFIFSDERERSFWMKDTLIPLDIIFIDQGGRIVSITHDAQPCNSDDCPTYKSGGKSQFVLEVNSGFAQKRNLVIGDTINFDID